MATTTTPPPLPAANERLRIAQLTAAKRGATALLAVVSAAFLALVVLTDGTGWSAYALAAAEGGMVGGLADWFAVTALFRHPLGVPIPHTAIIRERKDQFGATLGQFVQENFLSPEIIGERVHASHLGARVGEWLANRDNAVSVSGSVTDMLVAVADVFRDEDVHRLLDEELARAVEHVPAAPLAGKALRVATTDGRHQEVLDTLLKGIENFMDQNDEELRARLGKESPWWLPGAAQDGIFERLVEGVHELVHQVNHDPDHELRKLFDERIAAFAERLEHDPELFEKGEQVKHDILAHPQLREWSSGLWTDAKVALRSQATDPDSPLRRRVADGVVAVGERLRGDPVLQEKVEGFAETAARYVADHYHDEIADLVSSTVSRWDPDETSWKLELLLGRDLQFIRVNGTLVGALAGLLIHTVAELIG